MHNQIKSDSQCIETHSAFIHFTYLLLLEQRVTGIKHYNIINKVTIMMMMMMNRWWLLLLPRTFFSLSVLDLMVLYHLPDGNTSDMGVS